MLVLSRKRDEKIIIGDNIVVMVVRIDRDEIRLGIEAPKDISIHREEVYQANLRRLEIDNSNSEPRSDGDM
jgi:carbon storage regulator